MSYVDLRSFTPEQFSQVIIDKIKLYGTTHDLGILSGSSIAATATSSRCCCVYFQEAKGGIYEAASGYNGLGWTVSSSELFTAKTFTPLAAVSWDEGKEIRVYCLSEDDILQDYCYSSSCGNRWTRGYLSNLNVRAASNSSIAAVHWKDVTGGIQIRIYCQESSSGAIQEYIGCNPWTKGETFPPALTGSSIAVVKWGKDDVIHLRIYYQDRHLALKEHCYDGGYHEGWHEGKFRPGRAMRRSSITALGWYDTEEQLRVYWQNSQRELVECSWHNGWGFSTVMGPLPGAHYFSAIEWNDGDSVRIYYQGKDDDILEKCNDGDAWFNGSGVAMTWKGMIRSR